MIRTTGVGNISVLHTIFKHRGLAKQLLSENGPQFTSEKFEQFLVTNTINHNIICSSPYHLATNDAAERLIQTVKQAIHSGSRGRSSLERALAPFLLQCHCMPQATAGVSTSLLIVERNLITCLDLFKPNVGAKVTSQQDKQKVHHVRHSYY